MPTLRQRSLALVVALCLLLAQGAAVLHELSHLSGGARSVDAWQTSLRQVGPGKASELCLECLAFSAVAVIAAAGAVVQARIAAATPPRARGHACADRSTRLAHFDARGPPALL